MYFVVTKLERLFTMKRTKILKVTPHCLGHGNRAFHFFIELAHGIARVFMVNSLVWRLPMPFMLRDVQSHSSALQEA